MVGRRTRCGNASEVRFSDPPWNEESPKWREIDEELSKDHPARVVVHALKLLDLKPLFNSYSASGTNPIRPDLMLAVVLTEIWEGRHRPSQWYKDTQVNMALKWAGFGICPCRTSWYYFRDRLGPFLDEWFRELLEVAQQWGITKADRGSIDGSTVEANASRHHLLNEKQLSKRLAEIQSVCELDEQMEASERVPAWMAKRPGTRLQQRERYERAKERLEEFHRINSRQNPARRRPKEKIVVSPTDPAAALGRDKLKVFRPLYNVQIVTDLDSPLILGYEVFAQSTDGGTLGPMLRHMSDKLGIELRQLLGDSTYITGSNLAICDQRDVIPYGPWQENDYSGKKKKKKEGKIPKEDFQWLAGEKTYRCPGGHSLKWIGKERRVQADGEVNVMHRYRCSPEHCRACSLSPSCTTNPARGRAVKRSEHEPLIDSHRSRMETEEAKALYRLRKQTVELGFADLKQNRELRRFSGRGRDRTRTETGLQALVHNLMIVTRSPPNTNEKDRPTLSSRENST